jgi:putative peptidoglycan lipid II flippase
MSTVKILFKVNFLLGLATIIGLFNNIIIAAFFGLTRTLDAYFAACLIPNFFMILFIDYMGKNFLPVYSKVIKEDKEKSSMITSSVINVVLIFSIFTTIIIVIFSEPIFALILPGFSQENIQEVTKIFFIIAPTIVLRSVDKFHEYIWQYNEKYTRVAFSNILPPAAVLLTILLGEDLLGLYSLPLGFLIGHILTFILLTIGVEYQYRFYINLREKRVKSIFFNSGIMMTSGFITKLRNIIQQFFASQLEAGAISGLALAERLCAPLSTRATVGVRMVVFSRSSKAIANGNIEVFSELYKNSVILISFLMIPVIVWVDINSAEITKILFMRGEFNAEMNRLTSLALLGLFPSVIFLGLIPILLSGFYALNKIYVPALTGPITTLFYFVSIWFLVDKFGVLGIALSTTFAASIQFFLLLFFLKKESHVFSVSQVTLKILTYTFVALISFYTTEFIAGSLVDENLLGLIFSSTLGLVLYLCLLWIFKDYGFEYARKKLFAQSKKKDVMRP